MIFRKASAFLPVRIFYAAKALTNTSVLRLMKQLGTELDTVSPGFIIERENPEKQRDKNEPDSGFNHQIRKRETEEDILRNQILTDIPSGFWAVSLSLRKH